MSSLPEDAWPVAESQRRMMHDEVKIVCQSAALWKMRIFLTGRVELFTGGWLSCCWIPKRDDARWSEDCMPRYNALKNGHLIERKGWTLYRSVSELLLGPIEGWRRMKWKLYAEVQRPEKRASSWKEGLISLPEGEWECWVPKRDDAENEKNEYKTDADEENRRGKYEHLFWWNLMYKKDFLSSAKYL